MFEHLPVAPPDSILGLSEAFSKDSRANKINLTVGVYKDEQGRTPILDTVKKAEASLLKNEMSKGYMPIEGHPEYLKAVTELVYGGSGIDLGRVAADLHFALHLHTDPANGQLKNFGEKTVPARM